MSRRLLLATLAAATAAGGAGVAIEEAHSDAYGRCEGSRPLFPARVIRVEVDWRLVTPGYDCVYTLRYGAKLRLPPCPDGKHRPAAIARCVPGSA